MDAQVAARPPDVAAAWLRGLADTLFASPRSPVFHFLGWLMASAVWWHGVGFGAVVVVGTLARETVAFAPAADGALAVRVVAAGVGACNVAAFASFRAQWRGLVGARGLQPAAAAFPDPPFPWPAKRKLTDAALGRVVDGGVAAAVLSVFTVFHAPRVAPVLFVYCGLSYLALVRVSGDFLGLQSDANVVEIDALVAAALVGAAGGRARGPLAVLRFFAARKLLGCGVCKWHGSRHWRDLSALGVHYFTQPLPTPASATFHGFPAAAHRAATLATLVVELVAPLLMLLGSRRLRLGAWAAATLMLAAINASGTYGFIGALNFAENLALGDDDVFAPLAGLFASSSPPVAAYVFPARCVVGACLAFHVAISFLALEKAAKGDVLYDDLVGADAARRLRAAYGRLRRFRLCNYQGKFGSMHDFRWEVVLEGFDGYAWRPYAFKYKLNAGERGARVFAHLPRLDWRVWFLPLAAKRGRGPPDWYYALLMELHRNDNADVLALLRDNPFPRGKRPRKVRSRLEACTLDDRGTWVRAPVAKNPLDLVWPAYPT